MSVLKDKCHAFLSSTGIPHDEYLRGMCEIEITHPKSHSREEDRYGHVSGRIRIRRCGVNSLRLAIGSPQRQREDLRRWALAGPEIGDEKTQNVGDISTADAKINFKRLLLQQWTWARGVLKKESTPLTPSC